MAQFIIREAECESGSSDESSLTRVDLEGFLNDSSVYDESTCSSKRTASDDLSSRSKRYRLDEDDASSTRTSLSHPYLTPPRHKHKRRPVDNTPLLHAMMSPASTLSSIPIDELQIDAQSSVSEGDTPLGHLTQIGVSVTPVKPSDDSLFVALSKLTTATPQETRTLITHYIGENRAKYAKLTGTEIEQYLTDLQAGARGGVYELQAFGEALKCSTISYATNTRRWTTHTQGGLLNGTAVALMLDMGQWAPMHARVGGAEHILELAGKSKSTHTPKRSPEMPKAFDIAQLKERIRGKGKNTPITGQQKMDRYLGGNMQPPPPQDQEANLPAMIMRIRNYCVTKNIKVNFKTGDELLTRVGFDSRVTERVRRTLFVRVDGQRASLLNFCLLAGAQNGGDVVLVDECESFEQQCIDKVTSMKLDKFPVSELCMRNLIVRASLYKTRTKKLDRFTIDESQLEETFLYNADHTIRMCTLDESLGDVETIWAKASRELMAKFACTETEELYRKIALEDKYEQLLPQLGLTVTVLPFAFSHWEGFSDLSRDEMIIEVTSSVPHYNEKICQAGEIVFCDATASLDRFNTSLFVLSTTHVASGIPLGAILTSDAREETLAKAFQMLTTILPSTAFFGRGPKTGPDVFMTDDDTAERLALAECWPGAVRLLCTFHFLQRRWTWLWEGKNNILNQHRKFLILQVKAMVYAQTPEKLEMLYKSLQSCEVASQYPNYLEHMNAQWEKRHQWAHCFRKQLIIRGNHTNNYAEAGIRIIKELVFGRVKAYNHIQMFHFLVETMEMYYQKKLISIANNRMETYIALRFQGINAKQISKEDIRKAAEDGWYKVRSQTDKATFHDVSPNIGICTCSQGRDGSPCSHQAAIVLHTGEESVNYIGTLSAQARLKIGQLALGDSAIQNVAFYASLHQQALQEKYCREKSDLESEKPGCDGPDLTGSEWELIRAHAWDDEVDASVNLSEQHQAVEELCAKIDSFTKDLKGRLQQKDYQLISGVEKFITRYSKLTSTQSQASLASAFHQFGSSGGGVVRHVKGGFIRHGKRIPVQATAAGRRRVGITRGKSKIPAGRYPLKQGKYQPPSNNRYCLPTRREPKGKRLHSLSASIEKGTQNAGKW